MIRLQELIAALERQAKMHGNIECDIWISDGSGHAMSASKLPQFEYQPDEQCGDWLAIDFKGRRQQAGRVAF